MQDKLSDLSLRLIKVNTIAKALKAFIILISYNVE